MPRNYVFMTDSDSDLPYDIADARGIQVIKMPYAIDGKEYLDDNGRTNDPHAFFQKMRDGAAPNTSLLPIDAYLETWEPILKDGQDILFIAFSSKMSATLNNAREAREMLLKKYPERKLLIVDTLLISAPMSLLLMRAHDLYQQGASMEEIEQFVLDRRFHFQTWMTVDDLKYLKRGGRISPTKAFFGSMLDIKPIISMGKNGLMVNVGQVKGRKKALRTIIDDVIGIIVLTVVIGFKQPDSKVSDVILRTGAFFLLAFVFGFVIFKLFKWYDARHPHTRRIPILGIALAFALSYVADRYFGVADITGAYVAGVILCSLRDSEYITQKMDTNSYMIFGPVFFCSIGLSTNIRTLDMTILWFSLAFVAVGLLSKVLGCGLTARLLGFKGRNALKVGCGMMTRGEVALIVAQRGLKAGMLEPAYFTAVILLIIVSSILTPLILKFLYSKDGPEESGAEKHTAET